MSWHLSELGESMRAERACGRYSTDVRMKVATREMFTVQMHRIDGRGTEFFVCFFYLSNHNICLHDVFLIVFV